MKRKIIALFSATVLATCFLFSACAKTPSDSGSSSDSEEDSSAIVADSLQIGLEKGLLYSSDNACDSYKIYANNEELDEVREIDGYPVAEKIITEFSDYAREWKIEAVGYDRQGNIIKTSKQAEEFNIKSLYSDNFISALNGAYSAKDYFVLEEDIALYGVEKNDSTGYPGYTSAVMTAAGTRYQGDNLNAGPAFFLISKPFSATLNGMGYTVSVLVDKRMNFVSSQLSRGYAGLFFNMTETSLISNTAFDIDMIYTAGSGRLYGASLVYGDMQGDLVNCYVKAVMRPVNYVKGSDDPLYDRYVYTKDYKSSVIGSAGGKGNAVILKDCVFHVEILDEENNEKEGGGIIGVCQSDVTMENCVLIKYNDRPLVNNLGCTYSENGQWYAQMSASAKADAKGVYYYENVTDFLSGRNGYGIVEGQIDYKTDLNEYGGICYGKFDTEYWRFIDDEIYFGQI